MVTRRKKRRRKMGAGRMWKRKPKMAFPPSTRGGSVTHSERKRKRKRRRRRKRTRKENVQCGESKRTTERAFVRMTRRRRENNAEEEEEKQKKTEKTMRGRPTRLVTTKVPTIALKSKETNVACCGSG
jgi:hypothetical protein